MMSLDKIKKNLGIHANDYSEDELIKAREDLYTLANLAVEHYYETINKNKID